MIEKIKAVNNPLTIIAIFAALAEIAGTTVLAVVDKEIQHIFVWFVMLFPSLLVGLFFFTLYSKARVLYAPSDFKDEKNFLIALAGTHNLFVTVDVRCPNRFLVVDRFLDSRCQSHLSYAWWRSILNEKRLI